MNVYGLVDTNNEVASRMKLYLGSDPESFREEDQEGKTEITLINEARRFVEY